MVAGLTAWFQLGHCEDDSAFVMGFWGEVFGRPEVALKRYKEVLESFLDDWLDYDFAGERITKIEKAASAENKEKTSLNAPFFLHQRFIRELFFLLFAKSPNTNRPSAHNSATGIAKMAQKRCGRS